MKTIRDILQVSAEYLGSKGVDKPRFTAELLLAGVLGVNRLDLYLNLEKPLLDQELAKLRHNIIRSAKGEPIQYIEGQVQFYNCLIKVTPAVLIPRQETELLVDKIFHVLKGRDPKDKVLWDICTGSGCIAIALKKALPELKVIASDISNEALMLARHNAAINSVQIDFRLGNLFEPFEKEKAHFIVSNPPYVTEGEYQELEPSVKCFEPKIALVSGESGLEIYEQLAAQLPSYLEYQGKCWLEIGATQGDAILRLFADQGFRNLSLEKDLSSKDRFFSLENERIFE